MLLLKTCPETKDNGMFLDVLSSDIYFQKSNPEKKVGGSDTSHFLRL